MQSTRPATDAHSHCAALRRGALLMLGALISSVLVIGPGRIGVAAAAPASATHTTSAAPKIGAVHQPRSPLGPLSPSGATTSWNFLATASPTAATSIAVGAYGTATTAYALIDSLSNGIWTATNPPMPGSTTANGSVLYAISCPSAGTCFAAGDYYDNSGDQQGLLLSLSSGTWAATNAPLPSDAATNPQVTIRAISCATSTFCAATVNYTTTRNITPYSSALEVLSGGTWTVTESPLPADNTSTTSHLYAVSCSAAASCVATGNYSSNNLGALVETLASGSWTGSEPPQPTGASGTSGGLSSITCSSSTSCFAVGGYDYNTTEGLIATLSGSTWSAISGPLPSNYRSSEDYSRRASAW